MEHQHGVKADDKQQQQATRPAAQASRAAPAQTHAVAHLQQMIGNRALGRLVQAKLNAAQSEDVYEREADEVASRITGMTSPASSQAEPQQQHTPHPHTHQHAEKPSAHIAARVQRRDAVSVDSSSRNVTSSSNVTASRSVDQSLSSSAVGGGAPLPNATRSAMESHFGVAFDGVRVHTNDEAVSLNREMNADAFTHGSDIYFGAGQFRPDTSAGQHLLAHELTHVVQQGAAAGDTGAGGTRGSVAPRLQLKRRAHAKHVVEDEAEATPQKSSDSTSVEHAPAPLESWIVEAEKQRQAQAARDQARDQVSYEAGIKADAIRIHDGFEKRDIDAKADALAALEGRGLSVMQDIVRVFKTLYNRDLRDWIIRHSVMEYTLVKAMANLRWGHSQGDHVRMGLAIIPWQTHNAEVQRILSERDYKARLKLKEQYDETFKHIGKTTPDTLEKHLEEALYGWDRKKAVAFMHHDLTQAEHLYFYSYGIGHVKSSQVVGIIRDTWKEGSSQGIRDFEQLDNDWANYVVKHFGFSDVYLYDHLKRSLWFSDWDEVRVVLNAFYGAKHLPELNENLRQAGKGHLADFNEESLQRLTAAETVKAATGKTRLTTNEALLQKALVSINKIHQERIARAIKSGNQEQRKQYEAEWRKERDELAEKVRTYKIPLTDLHRKKTMLFLAGDLQPADEVWASLMMGEYENTLSLITKFWAQGKIDDMLLATFTPRIDSLGNEIRPEYQIEKLLHGIHDIQFKRIYALIRADKDDVGRGLGRLQLELQQGSTDSDLRAVYELLNTTGIKPALRQSVLQRFADLSAKEFDGRDANEKFLNYLAAHYERRTFEGVVTSTFTPHEENQGSNYWMIKRLLVPPTTASQKIERAHQEKAATEKGSGSGVLKTVTRIGGAIIGERYEDVVEESLQGLEFVSTASLTELEPLMEQWGVKTREALIDKMLSTFDSQMKELREARTAIASAVAGAVEVGVEAGLSLFTGGAGLAAVIGSMVSTVASIGVQEVLLGADYKMVSAENAKNILMSGLGTSQNELKDTRTMIADVLNEKRTNYLKTLSQLSEGDAVKMLAAAGHHEAAELLKASAGRNLAGILEGEALKLGATPLVKQAAAAVAGKTGAEALQALSGPRYKPVRKLVEKHAPQDMAKVLESSARMAKVFGKDAAASGLSKGALLVTEKVAQKKDLAKRAASGMQNTLAAIADSVESSMVSTFLDATMLDKYPSVHDLAAEAYKLATITVARPLHGVAGTYKINPGKLHDYMPAAERLKVNVIFKIALKVSQGTAKDIATYLAMDTSRMSLAEIAGLISQKMARGIVSTVTKATATAWGQGAKADVRREDVAQLMKKHPDVVVQVVGNMVKSDPTLNARYLKETLAEGKSNRPTEGQWLIERMIKDKSTVDIVHKELVPLTLMMKKADEEKD